MKPPAKLHNKTGRLKNFNKTFTNPSESTPAPTTATSRSSNSNAPASTANQAAQAAATGTATAAAASASSPPISSALSTVMDTVVEQFELELYWCIQTLEKSLESNKLNAKQVQDVEKTIRLLKSSNQPLVKKRQLMQTTLGNYRKKMQDEERKLRAGNSAIQFIVDTDKNKSKTPAAKSNANNKGHFVKKSFAASLGETRFQFNFPVEAIEKLSLNGGDETNGRPEQTQDAASAAEATCDAEQHTEQTTTPNSQPSEAPSNPFAKAKFAASDNSFKFNFSI